MQEKWFNECLSNNDVKVFNDGEFEFVIYKGVKLVKTNDGFRLLDVRFNDFYSRLAKPYKRILRKHGFVKGCDIMMYERDLMRCRKYERYLEELYTYKKRLLKKLDEVTYKRPIRKKLGVMERKASDAIDDLFFYNSRKEQFEVKYKLNQ